MENSKKYIVIAINKNTHKVVQRSDKCNHDRAEYIKKNIQMITTPVMYISFLYIKSNKKFIGGKQNEKRRICYQRS